MNSLRTFAGLFRKTPLHPQWLLGVRRPPSGISMFEGIALDIGAADKWIAKHLAAEVQYVALDYPATGAQMYGARPDVFADAARLPFRDAVFDAVICLEVLEHVPDPGQVVMEISRVLKTNGRAWISMPFLYPLHDAPFDFQRYTEYGLRRDVERSGLRVVSLNKKEHAIKAVGLLACLAIAGALHKRTPLMAALLLPFAAMMVLGVNVMAYGMSILWPDWQHISSGYELQVYKLPL